MYQACVQADKGTPVASALGQAGTASTATAASVETATKEKKKKEKKEKKVRCAALYCTVFWPGSLVPARELCSGCAAYGGCPVAYSVSSI